MKLNRRIDERIRFFSKVERAENGCLMWTACTRYGYGLFNRYPLKKTIVASRMAWILEYGEIPDGMFVLHKCDNPGCVEPSHLFIGTQVDNMRDKKAKGRGNNGMKHGNARLTDELVREIRGADGTYAELGRKYGVVPSTVWQIKHRRTWAHI